MTTKMAKKRQDISNDSVALRIFILSPYVTDIVLLNFYLKIFRSCFGSCPQRAIQDAKFFSHATVCEVSRPNLL